MATKYDGKKWTKISSLLALRNGHRSVSRGNEIIHVGGASIQ